MDAKAAAKLARAEARQAKRAARSTKGEGDATPKHVETAEELNAAERVATGVLASEKRSRDVKITSFSLTLHGRNLVEDTTIELNWGQRYGLIGRNGCGKSTFLRCLAEREVPIPDHIDTYLLSEEAKVRYQRCTIFFYPTSTNTFFFHSLPKCPPWIMLLTVPPKRLSVWSASLRKF